MLLWLRQNPISSASQILTDVPKIRYENRQLPLRRFAPNKVTELAIQGESRRWRIVYALAKDFLIVENILHHDNFDNVYMSS
jgi:hypothetical protein